MVRGELYTEPEERKPTIHISMYMNGAKSAFLVVAASRIRRLQQKDFLSVSAHEHNFTDQGTEAEGRG